MAQELGRDVLFREFFRREPTKDELQWFDRLENLMGIPRDDSLWFYVIMCEFYDDRFKARLAHIDRISDSAADRALEKIAETVLVKADSIAADKEKAFIWRSWAILMGFVVLLCAVVFNAGYVAGSGHPPFWLRSEGGFFGALGWFLSVPSGWIFLLASAPALFETYSESTKKINTNKRMEITGKENSTLMLKAAGSFIALGITGMVVLYLTVLNVLF